MINPFFVNPFVNIFVIILVIWTISWKIYAVWLAVKHNHKKWFVVLIVLNTLGILEIFYIFQIANKTWDDVKRDFHRALDAISNK